MKIELDISHGVYYHDKKGPVIFFCVGDTENDDNTLEMPLIQFLVSGLKAQLNFSGNYMHPDDMEKELKIVKAIREGAKRYHKLLKDFRHGGGLHDGYGENK